MHLENPAKVVSFKRYDMNSYAPDQISGPDDPAFGKRILCEGDSWFSLGAVPSSNLLFPLRFRQQTLLINLATPGDTLLNMQNPRTNPDFRLAMKETKWDAIFISGGGNDLIDNLDNIICTPSAGAGQHFLDYIDRMELAKLGVKIHTYHRSIDELRNSTKNAGVPIVTHVYDYPTPRNAKANFLGMGLRGPWLYRALMLHQVPAVHWISITDYIFESLGAMLIDLVGKIDNFHVIDKTRGVLDRARLGTTGSDGDWLNEIHANKAGYQKLADVISPELDLILFPS